MKLSDVMGKLGSGQALTSVELSFLKTQMDLVQNTTAITSGWIHNNGIRVPNLYADHAEFKTLPGNVVVRGLISTDTPFSVANMGAFVNWDTADWSIIYNDVYPCVTFSGTKIDLPNRIPTIISINGSVRFLEDSGVLSIAAAYLDIYNRADDTLSASIPLFVINDYNDNVFGGAFAITYYWDSPKDKYLQIRIYQNNGDACDMDNMHFTFTRIK